MARSNEANKKVYPDWVQKYREKGTAIKKSGIIIIFISILQSVFLERNILFLSIHMPEE